MSQCGCGGSAEVSVSRVAWRKAEGGQYADGGHGEGEAATQGEGEEDGVS